MLKRTLATHFTEEEFLALEAASETKHEYYDGKIYDMSGGTPDHSLIALNLGAALKQQLKPTPCRVYGSDLQIRIQDNRLYTYPDLSVVCGKLQYVPDSKTVITNPLILVEVLSPTTRTYDRGKKFGFYKNIPSVQEVVLVEAERPHVEVLRRATGGQWTIDMYDSLDAVMVLKAAPSEISLRDVYDGVSWLE